MTVSQEFVVDKLTNLTEYQAELATLLKMSDQDLLGSPVHFHAAERLVQLLVDAMLDINQHLIREQSLDVPNDLFNTFILLGTHGILEPEFAQHVAPIVGVRNRLVHQYEKLDRKLFLKNLRKNFGDFDRYREQIQHYLQKI